MGNSQVRCCYIIGGKSIGMYGGFETFILKLLQQHENNRAIKYFVSCKANGPGHMDLYKLSGIERINENEFTYCNAHGFLVKVPEKIGPAQAIYYDLKSIQWVCDHIERNHIHEPVVYILASRIGIFEKKYVKRIHDAGGRVYHNPDGHEDWRKKWPYPVRRYWKLSERYAIKNADLVICDSRNIEKYIREEYAAYKPQTSFIAYGSSIKPSSIQDDDPRYLNWLAEHGLKDGEFYISVGRFVPENNFEIMIREFMQSHTDRDFAIITTENPGYAAKLQKKLGYKKDKRIKFVGSVYNAELLTKIRNNACGYLHGHEVGGTNPSLLESLGSTRLNLLLDNGFNREVAEDAALYWTKEKGSLAGLIDKADKLTPAQIEEYGDKARGRIHDEYSWEKICDKYAAVFTE